MAEKGPIDAPITLDQLRVFLSVVEEGSFSKAARRLRRVQSAVSYAIAQLERLLDLELFDRTGRQPKLTPAGRALVPEARAVVGQVDQFQARARDMARGVEAALDVAVDMLLPMPAVLAALEGFSDEFPNVALGLRAEALGAVAQLVVAGACDIGLSVDIGSFPSGLSREPFTRIEMVPVTAAAHSLAARAAPVDRAMLRDELQIIVSDRSTLTEGHEIGVLSDRQWRVADLRTKLDLLVAGFGWGSVPRHLLGPELAAGRLVELDIEGRRESETWADVFAIHRASEPPGPAGRWFLAALSVAIRGGE